MSEKWQARGLMQAIQYNLRNNGLMALGQMIVIPIAFRMGRKILNKPLILPANRLLKQSGLEIKL